MASHPQDQEWALTLHFVGAWFDPQIHDQSRVDVLNRITRVGNLSLVGRTLDMESRQMHLTPCSTLPCVWSPEPQFLYLWSEDKNLVPRVTVWQPERPAREWSVAWKAPCWAYGLKFAVCWRNYVRLCHGPQQKEGWQIVSRMQILHCKPVG